MITLWECWHFLTESCTLDYQSFGVRISLSILFTVLIIENAQSRPIVMLERTLKETKVLQWGDGLSQITAMV